MTVKRSNDPTLEETSDELLRLFLDEIELYFQNYYGTGADMVAKKEKEMFIKQLWIARMQKDM